jgi:hypothetical protein
LPGSFYSKLELESVERGTTPYKLTGLILRVFLNGELIESSCFYIFFVSVWGVTPFDFLVRRQCRSRLFWHVNQSLLIHKNQKNFLYG